MTFILKICFAVLFALLVSTSVESATMMKREIQTENQSDTQTQAQTTEKPIRYCDHTMSCGWAIYEGFTREMNYFMKNSCECPEPQHCVRVDDDAALSAFVYKCRNKRTTVAPTTTE